MPKRISQADDSRELQQTSKPQTQVSYPEMPEDYSNPFNDKHQIMEDGYPMVFSDIDWEFLHNPRYFAGMEKIVYKQSESKSEIIQLYKYTRWKTWKYLEEQPKQSVVMTKSEDEEEFARGTVSINGVIYFILKGEEVFVPLDVKTMILTCQKQTGAAGRRDLVSSIGLKLDPKTKLPKDPSRLDK